MSEEIVFANGAKIICVEGEGDDPLRGYDSLEDKENDAV